MRALQTKTAVKTIESRIWERVNPHLSTIKGVVQLGDVVVALWARGEEERTPGGIIVPGATRDENIYQGKCGLVLMMGPQAFEDDPDRDPPIVWPVKAEVGDWVVFRVSDGWPFLIGEQHCRLVNERGIRMVVDRPDVVF